MPSTDDQRRLPWDQDAYLELVGKACFICEMLAGNPEYPHHIAYRDDTAVVFLSKFPFLRGQLLVAPVTHREQVVGDFTLDEYLALQTMVHTAGLALTELLPTERLYMLSLGSQQGNRHVHWHLAPLPPGVPYARQQFGAFAGELGYLDMSDEDMAALAEQLGAAISRSAAWRSRPPRSG